MRVGPADFLIHVASPRNQVSPFHSLPGTASSIFLQRFLRFVVEKSLAGDGDKLKEYVIGTEVFGRASDYESQLDSLVRVEAHRLRAALEQYYRWVTLTPCQDEKKRPSGC